MRKIAEKLREAIEQQKRLDRGQRRAKLDLRSEAAFRPVFEAAAELRDELKHVPDIKITIDADGVWIELYDKHLWFGYDPKQRTFAGTEAHSLWMEGGLREESFTWDTAEACTEAMIQACARYVWLAESLSRFRPQR
jgi:hypothetical protein